MFQRLSSSDILQTQIPHPLGGQHWAVSKGLISRTPHVWVKEEIGLTYLNVIGIHYPWLLPRETQPRLLCWSSSSKTDQMGGLLPLVSASPSVQWA